MFVRKYASGKQVENCSKQLNGTMLGVLNAFDNTVRANLGDVLPWLIVCKSDINRP